MTVTALDELSARLRDECMPWRRLLIGIDGRDGEGKLTTARWLAYRLGMPALETDTYLLAGARDYTLRYDELRRSIESRLDRDRPVLVEGVFLLRTLERIGLAADVLVYVKKRPAHKHSGLESQLKRYRAKYRPERTAQYTYRWVEPAG